MSKKGEPQREPSSARREKPHRRAPWLAPRIEDHGSIRHLFRGSTGPKGDVSSGINFKPL